MTPNPARTITDKLCDPAMVAIATDGNNQESYNKTFTVTIYG